MYIQMMIKVTADMLRSCENARMICTLRVHSEPKTAMTPRLAHLRKTLSSPSVTKTTPMSMMSR